MKPTMAPTTSSYDNGTDFLLYDGECPFCSAYVKMTRLKDAGVKLQLLNAREHTDLVEKFAAQGFEIDSGMVMQLGGATYFGADVMHAVTALTTPASFFNRLNKVLFSNRSFARFVYPGLRAARNLTLRLMGRKLIRP